MNSRIEGGEMTLPSKQAVVEWVRQGLKDEEIEVDEGMIAYYLDDTITDKSTIPLEGAEQYISYWANDGLIDYERKIYFPENDSVDRIKQSLFCDEKAKEYVNPDAVADFIFNCVDVNALGVVQGVALVWDEPILDEEGEVEEYETSAAREQLMEEVAEGDEYAYEVGLEKLGINWVERSAILINISEIVKVSQEIAEELAADYGTNPETEFDAAFRECLVSTILHEYRHAVYEMNEFTPYDDERYPKEGFMEQNVEQYGRDEASDLMMPDSKARPYIAAMFNVGEAREKGDREKSHGSKKQKHDELDR